MWLKKVSSAPIEADRSHGPLNVLVEAFPGHSADEIADSLRQMGAAEVNIVSGGWVSARADSAAISAVENMAHVHPQHTKVPHGG